MGIRDMSASKRDEARNTANRIWALLEIAQQLCPQGDTDNQRAQIDRVNDGIYEALLGIKAYVYLRNNENP